MPDPLDEYYGSSNDTTATIRQGSDGRYYRYDAGANQWLPISGMPEDELKRLEREIMVARRRAASSDIDEAYLANQQAKQLEEQYRELQELRAKPASPKATESWSPGNTSSPYLLRPRPDGSLEQMPNPNYVPPREPAGKAERYPEDVEYSQLRNQKAQYDLEGGTPWQQAWQQKEWEYKQRQDEQKRQQWQQEMEQQKRQDAWRMASDLMATQLKAAPMAQIPGQTHFLGYEPGGVWSQVAGNRGVNFDADRFRAPIINIDPEQAWQQAWGRTG